MTFRIALSGLNAASQDLNVTANNIANANTTGFKQSRALFADVYAQSSHGLTNTAMGSGTRLSLVQQQFAQGSVDFTDSALDLAISGEGFFTLSEGGSLAYTRAGAFGTDRDGYVVNPQGARLQVFPPLTGGTFDTGRLTDLQLSQADNPPSPSGEVGLGLNLPADATPPAVAPFDATDPQTYNHTTSLTVYDSLGSAHTAAFYYVKNAAANTWDMYATIDGTAVGGANPVVYDSAGALVTPATGSLTLPAHDPGTGAAMLNLDVELSSSTQFGDTFSVNSLRQDGYTTGRLTGIEITPEGIVNARFTNGQANALGQVAMTSFSNPQGLQQLSDTAWGETYNSGQALRGTAGSSNLGLVQSGALEASNVDLTEQLVNMITAQRNFQANAQMISTSDQITQTIINIR